MEWIGELERAFATTLYPLRVPIAIGGVLALGALVIVARRRGWFAAARRHPGRSAVLAAAVLVVGGPIAWYLGSPLFIRTSLAEPAPASSDPPAASADVTPAGARAGSFVGADEFHFGSGTARLIETAPGMWTIRFEDFSVRNGPDLFVYLSPDPGGYVAGAVELGALKATDGSFNTDVPAGTNVGEMRSVVIWCKQFAVQFAAAALQ